MDLSCELSELGGANTNGGSSLGLWLLGCFYTINVMLFHIVTLSRPQNAMVISRLHGD